MKENQETTKTILKNRKVQRRNINKQNSPNFSPIASERRKQLEKDVEKFLSKKKNKIEVIEPGKSGIFKDGKETRLKFTI